MKKLRLLFVAALLLPATSLFAQGYVTLGYGPSFPLAQVRDYIDKTSWRSLNLEAGWFFTKDLSLGVAFSWYGYYKSYPYQTYENIENTTVTVTGRQWRYVNFYPLVAVAKYYIPFKDLDFKPFVGVAAGAVFADRRLDFGVYTISENTIQLGFYPELGFSYWINDGLALSLDARYNYSLKTNTLPSHSNVALNLGVLWKFGERNFTFTN